MARKQLINLHSSVVKHPSGVTLSPDIKIGEIIVQAVETAATIYTKVGDETGKTFAEFIDKTQIQALDKAIADRVDLLETSASTLTSNLASVSGVAGTALQSISATGDSYVSAVAENKANNSQKVVVTANVADDLENVTNKGLLADAYDVRVLVSGETKARQDAELLIKNDLSAVTEDVNYAISGLTIDADHSIKTYVDGRVSQVYRVKGSVADDTELPTSDVEIGDVYNIQNETSYGPSGTNVVCISVTPAIEWDALGGTYDFSGYALNTTLQAEIQNRQDADKEINDKLGSGFTTANTVAEAIEAAQNAADAKLANVTVSGDDYVDASANTASNNTQAIKVTSNVAKDLQSVGSGDTKLADAYAVKVAINAATGKTQDAQDDVDALEIKVGALSGEVLTLSGQVQTLASDSLSSVLFTGNDYIGVTATGISNNVESVTFTCDVAEDFSAISADTTQLANAYQVKTYIDAEVNSAKTAANLAIEAVDDKVDAVSGTVSTINTRLTSLEGVAVTSLTATGDDYVSLTKSEIDGNSYSLTLAADVAGDISGITVDTKQLADAYKVKAYVDDKISNVTSTTSSLQDEVNGIKGTIGTFPTGSTIAEAISTLQSHEITAASATGITGVTASIVSGHTVQYDFTDMVIDCGTY
jgi:hypothetical protein